MVKILKEKDNLKNKKGITLIALVITIIVLLILAGVSIMTLAGDNGLLTRTVGAKNKTTLAGMEEELNLAYMSVYTGKAGSGAINSGVSLDEIYNDASLPSEIKSHIVRLGGVSTVSLVNTDQRNVTILAEDGAITSSGTAGTNTVSIQVEEGSNSYAYWLESEGVYYPMSIANGRVVLDKENISTTEPTGEGSLGSGIEVTFKDSGAAEATENSSYVTKKSTSKSGNITTITLEAAGAGSTEVVVKSGNIGLTGGNISVIVSPVYTLQFGTMTNGDIVITTGGQERAKNTKYASGTQIVLKATGRSGYAFEKWYDNGTENTSVTTASRTIEVGAGTAEITYTATFKVSLGHFKTVEEVEEVGGEETTVRKAYYYPGTEDTNGVEITESNIGNYLGMKVNYTPTGAKTVSSKTIGTGKNGSETSPTYRLFYVDVNGDYGEEGTIYLKADDDANNASLSALAEATGTTKMQQFNKKWWADTTKCNNSSYASYNNRISVNKLLDPSKWTEYKDASGENQIADYVVGAPSLEMWIDSYNAFLRKNTPTSGTYYELNCTVTQDATNGPTGANSGAGYYVGINGAYGHNSGWSADRSTLVNPLSYEGNPTAADRVEAWNRGTGHYWLASPHAGNSDFVLFVSGVYGCVSYDSYNTSYSFAFCPLVSIKSGVSIQEK